MYSESKPALLGILFTMAMLALVSTPAIFVGCIYALVICRVVWMLMVDADKRMKRKAAEAKMQPWLDLTAHKMMQVFLWDWYCWATYWSDPGKTVPYRFTPGFSRGDGLCAAFNHWVSCIDRMYLMPSSDGRAMFIANSLHARDALHAEMGGKNYPFNATSAEFLAELGARRSHLNEDRQYFAFIKSRVHQLHS